MTSYLPAKNRYHQFVNDLLYYQVWENPLRTQYPSFVRDLSMLTKWLEGIKKIAKIAPGISKVNISSDTKKRHYIFKSIKKPFYNPIDTKILQQELQNLKLFGQSTSIVQLIPVIISTNPYHTGKSEVSGPVLRGFLLEYQCDARRCAEREFRVSWIEKMAGSDSSWTSTASSPKHRPYGTETFKNCDQHQRDDAVIIDISSIAVTNGWLTPKMHEMDDHFSLPWKVRRRNDIWAYGTLLWMIAQLESDGNQARLLNEIIEKTEKIEPSERVELCHPIANLEQNPTSELCVSFSIMCNRTFIYPRAK